MASVETWRGIGWIFKLLSAIFAAPPSLRARSFLPRILVTGVLEAIQADVSVGHFSKRESRGMPRVKQPAFDIHKGKYEYVTVCTLSETYP